MVAIA
ncbi:Protein of unknown function [Bacillus cytotoxicus]